MAGLIALLLPDTDFDWISEIFQINVDFVDELCGILQADVGECLIEFVRGEMGAASGLLGAVEQKLEELFGLFAEALSAAVVVFGEVAEHGESFGVAGDELQEFLVLL